MLWRRALFLAHRQFPRDRTRFRNDPHAALREVLRRDAGGKAWRYENTRSSVEIISASRLTSRGANRSCRRLWQGEKDQAFP